MSCWANRMRPGIMTENGNRQGGDRKPAGYQNRGLDRPGKEIGTHGYPFYSELAGLSSVARQGLENMFPSCQGFGTDTKSVYLITRSVAKLGRGVI